jgi:hypothetical protein
MRITITIPDELAAEVRSRGVTPETYVEQLLAEKVVPTPAEISTEERLADLERFFAEMAVFSKKLPSLPDEAFTRESFYRDRY